MFKTLFESWPLWLVSPSFPSLSSFLLTISILSRFGTVYTPYLTYHILKKSPLKFLNYAKLLFYPLITLKSVGLAFVSSPRFLLEPNQWIFSLFLLVSLLLNLVQCLECKIHLTSKMPKRMNDSNRLLICFVCSKTNFVHHLSSLAVLWLRLC